MFVVLVAKIRETLGLQDEGAVQIIKKGLALMGIVPPTDSTLLSAAGCRSSGSAGSATSGGLPDYACWRRGVGDATDWRKGSWRRTR